MRHDFFRDIDEPIKAYLLGLVAADGNVLGRPPRISLELSVKDIELVELFRDAIAKDVKIRRRRATAIVAVTSAEMARDLRRWGVRPRKTYEMEWPEHLPEAAKRPYLHGYFDGDGFITISRSWGRYRYPGGGCSDGRNFSRARASTSRRRSSFGRAESIRVE